MTFGLNNSPWSFQQMTNVLPTKVKWLLSHNIYETLSYFCTHYVNISTMLESYCCYYKTQAWRGKWTNANSSRAALIMHCNLQWLPWRFDRIDSIYTQTRTSGQGDWTKIISGLCIVFTVLYQTFYAFALHRIPKRREAQLHTCDRLTNDVMAGWWGWKSYGLNYNAVFSMFAKCPYRPHWGMWGMWRAHWTRPHAKTPKRAAQLIIYWSCSVNDTKCDYKPTHCKRLTVVHKVLTVWPFFQGGLFIVCTDLDILKLISSGRDR